MKNLTITLALLASALCTSCSDPDFTCHYDDIKCVEKFTDEQGYVYAYDMTIDTPEGPTSYAISRGTYTLLADTIRSPYKGLNLLFTSHHGEYYVHIDKTQHTKINLK